jgi:hypothetical protein
MNSTVSKVFSAVEVSEQERAAYQAIGLSEDEASSLIQHGPKPAQQ